MKLGRNKSVHDESKKSLSFSNYGNASQIAYPRKWAWERPIKYGDLGNITVGNCAYAAPGHYFQNTTAVVTGTPTDLVTTASTLYAYSAGTGYNPAIPSSDQGSNMRDTCGFMQSTGIAGLKIDGFATLDLQNIDQIRAAIYIFGGIYCGMIVPPSILDAINSGNVPLNWNFKNERASNEGHAVYVFGFGPLGFAFNSWGIIYHMDVNFFLNWMDEGYLLYSKYWIKASGLSPSNVDMAGLETDSNLLAKAA